MRSLSSILFLLSVILIGACSQRPSTPDGPDRPDGISLERMGTPALHVGSPLDERSEQALIEALADERKAEAQYRAVLAKFGDARPFSNIVNAERRHEAVLLPLFERYGVAVPENRFDAENVQISATLAGSCQTAINGEKANIAMYERFLEFVKEDDIREAFTYLHDASKNNHLPAFERCSQGGGRGTGR